MKKLLLLALCSAFILGLPIGAQDSQAANALYRGGNPDGAAFVPPDLSGPWPTAQRLSPDAKISVLTMEEGKDIYLSFGHSAFRVQDPAYGMDLVYNYGSFDLGNPLFIPNFVRGYLLYELIVQDFRAYLAYDRRTQNREWREQELVLSPEDTQRLFDFLNFNAHPDRNRYIYDFIKDNCATRIRDVLQLVFGDRVRFDLSPARDSKKSYRQLLDEYVYDRPGYQYSFYIVLGMASDQPSGPWIAAWLPDYLQDMIAHTTFFDLADDGSRTPTPRPLSKEVRVLYTPVPPSDYGEPWANPLFILVPALALAIFFLIRKLRVWQPVANMTTSAKAISQPESRGQAVLRFGGKLFDFVFFLLMGLAGLVVFYLEFFSIHTAVKGNLNLIWLLPTHVIAAFFVVLRRPPKFTGWYFAIFGAIFILQIVLLPIWPQSLSIGLVVTLLLAATRATNHALRSGVLDPLLQKILIRREHVARKAV